jgi:hypothetical protein
MMNRTIIFSCFITLLTLPVPLSLGGCDQSAPSLKFVSAGDYEAELLNGFSVFATDTDTVVVVPPEGVHDPSFAADNIVVGPKIVAVAIERQWVIGRTEIPSQSPLLDLAEKGWFVVDTVKNSARTGLDRNEIERILHFEYNILLDDVFFVPPHHLDSATSG